MTMSMNRAIHGAVRRDLTRFTGAIEVLEPGDGRRVRQLAAAWSYFEDQLTRHHHGEQAIAWPTLTSLGMDADLIAVMDREHEAMANALAGAGRAMSMIEQRCDQPARDDALIAFNRLRTVTWDHLEHEETVTEPVYLAHHDSDEIKSMSRAFRSEGAAQGGRLFVWVLDGAGPEERASIADSMPRPVLAALTGIFGRDYRRNVAPAWSG